MHLTFQFSNNYDISVFRNLTVYFLTFSFNFEEILLILSPLSILIKFQTIFGLIFLIQTLNEHYFWIFRIFTSKNQTPPAAFDEDSKFPRIS